MTDGDRARQLFRGHHATMQNADADARWTGWMERCIRDAPGMTRLIRLSEMEGTDAEEFARAQQKLTSATFSNKNRVRFI